jgi:hypothetical protein
VAADFYEAARERLPQGLPILRRVKSECGENDCLAATTFSTTQTWLGD